MIGQKNLLKHIDWLCKANAFPRFSIIVGPAGSEKQELARYTAVKLECFLHSAVDNKIDTIRDIIEESYKTHAPIVYVFNNADDMSIPAKNALLKVTEEPSNNAYFIMILEDLNNTLDTIRSRATAFATEPYSKNELMSYAEDIYHDNNEIYFDLCSTPGEIDLLHKMGVLDFYSYVEKVVDNIADVSGANSFKVAEKVALKDEEDKYDLRMFWKACCKLFFDKAVRFSDAADYVSNLEAVQKTSSAIKCLSIRGVNKQMLFDEWILDIREVLR